MRGVNDGAEELDALAAILRRVCPDQVHVVIPERPPAEPWVAPPDAEGLMQAVAILGPVAHMVHPYTNGIDVSDYATAGEAILSIIARHPMSSAQLGQLLARWNAAEVAAALAALEAGGFAHPVERLGTQFWAAAPSHFPAGGEGRGARGDMAALAGAQT